MFLTALVSRDQSILLPPEPAAFEETLADPAAIGFMSSLACRTGFGAPGLQCLDDGLRLVLKTKGIPIWFVVASLMIPAGVFAAFILTPLLRGGKFEPLAAVGCVLIPIIIADILGLVRFLNRRSGDGQVRFVFDRAAGTVELTDFGLTIPTKKIRRLILVQGYQTKKDKEGSNSTWVLELSLVAEGNWDGLRRMHVITAGRQRLSKIAETLAAMLHVPLTSRRLSLEIQCAE